MSTPAEDEVPAPAVVGAVFGYGFDDDDRAEASGPYEGRSDEEDGGDGFGTGAEALIGDAEEPAVGEATAAELGDAGGDAQDEGALSRDEGTGMEEEEDDGAREAAAAALRLAELEATNRMSSGRYSYQLWLATREAETLSRFLRAQHEVLDTAAHRTASTQERDGRSSASASATARAHGWGGGAGLAREPRVAASLLRLACAQGELAAQGQRVALLRRRLADDTTATRHADEAESEDEHMSLPPLTGFDEVRASPPARGELPDCASRGIVESAAVMKALLQVLPFLRSPEQRRAVERVCVGLGHLAGHTYHLLRYQAYLEGYGRAAVVDTVEAAVARETRGVLAAQAVQSADSAQLASTMTLAEARSRRGHAALAQRLADVQAALAALAVAKLGAATGPGGMDVGRASERAAVEADVQRLSGLCEALRAEVGFLRKEARAGVCGHPALTGCQYDLLLDAASSSAAAAAAGPGLGSGLLAEGDSRALSALTRALVSESHEKVAALVDSLLPTRKTTCVATPGEAEGSPAPTEDEAALLLRVLAAEERVAARHEALAALVAANARLTEEVRSVEHVATAATTAAAPADVRQLACALLAKCGLAPNDNEEEERSSGDRPVSLAEIERSVLELHEERVRELVDAANAHLAHAEEAWLGPERASRGQASFLLRMLAVHDHLALQRASTHAASAESLSASPSPVSPALARTVDALDSVAGADTLTERALAAPVPTLPRTNTELHATLRSRVRAPFEAAAAKWAERRTACEAAAAEIGWFEQFAVEDVPDRLAEAQRHKRALLQRTLDAGQRSRLAGEEKQRAIALAATLERIEQVERPPLEARVAELRAALVTLQEEYHQRKAASDLAREAAEAERQLREESPGADAAPLPTLPSPPPQLTGEASPSRGSFLDDDDDGFLADEPQVDDVVQREEDPQGAGDDGDVDNGDNGGEPAKHTHSREVSPPDSPGTPSGTQAEEQWEGGEESAHVDDESGDGPMSFDEEAGGLTVVAAEAPVVEEVGVEDLVAVEAAGVMTVSATLPEPTAVADPLDALAEEERAEGAEFVPASDPANTDDGPPASTDAHPDAPLDTPAMEEEAAEAPADHPCLDDAFLEEDGTTPPGVAPPYSREEQEEEEAAEVPPVVKPPPLFVPARLSQREDPFYSGFDFDEEGGE